MTGAQFEIRIDGTPRTYRDRKDYAMEAARLLKSKNPHSTVEVKDLKSGDVTAVVNWPPFRPDTRHNLEGLRLSSSTGLCLTTTNVSN